MNRIIHYLFATAKTIQLLFVLLLTSILYLICLNNADFNQRWQFESCNFSDLYPEGDKNILETVKKFWRFK